MKVHDDEARLFDECAACHDARTRYVRGCSIFADAEIAGDVRPEFEEALRRMSVHWREIVRRVSRIPAYTVSGLEAKGGVLRGCLADRPPDDVTELIDSLLMDLARLSKRSSPASA